MTDSWREFLEKHDRPRGEMDAGMLFGSDAAPSFRVKEIVQVAYRLNLMRPESAFVCDASMSPAFVSFFLAQMVPSLKKIRTHYRDGLVGKFPEITFDYGDITEVDVLWGLGTGSVAGLCGRVNKGGVAIVEDLSHWSSWDDFRQFAKAGNSSEVIIDTSEKDTIRSLAANGSPIPDTKYTKRLSSDVCDGGFGVVYF